MSCCGVATFLRWIGTYQTTPKCPEENWTTKKLGPFGLPNRISCSSKIESQKKTRMHSDSIVMLHQVKSFDSSPNKILNLLDHWSYRVICSHVSYLGVVIHLLDILKHWNKTPPFVILRHWEHHPKLIMRPSKSWPRRLTKIHAEMKIASIIYIYNIYCIYIYISSSKKNSSVYSIYLYVRVYNPVLLNGNFI